MFATQFGPKTPFAGGLTVERVLHAGAHSVVYEVTQDSTGKRRALKVIHGDLGKDSRFADAFLARARDASRIRSEHVAEVLDCGKHDDQPFAVMELLLGNSLEQELLRSQALPVEQGKQLLLELGHALAAAHDVGVVHGDLKPEGIILALTEAASAFRTEVQFVGAGRVASEVQQNTTAAMSRPMWMAPEQAEAGSALTLAVDVWSYGLLAFYVMTGRNYWKTARDAGSAMMTLMREVLYEPLVPASIRAEELGVGGKLPGGFDAWFERCVSRDPASRFPNARQAVSALAALMGNAPLSAAPPAPGTASPAATGPTPLAAHGTPSAPPPLHPPPTKKGGAGLALLLGLLLVLLGALGTGAYFTYRHFEDERIAAAKAAEAEREAKQKEADAIREKEEALARQWSDEDAAVPISWKDAHVGSRTAPVTLVVFTDFQCPFCKKLEDTLDAIAIARGPDQLRIVYKHNPLAFHKQAKPAAEIAMQVYAKKGFVAFAKLKSRAFSNREFSVDDLETFALDVGLKRKDLTDADQKAVAVGAVEKDIALAKQLGVKGVPAMFINGLRLTGAQPREKLDAAIEQEVTAAKAELEKGTKPERVYYERAKQNYSEPSTDGTKPTATDDDTWRVTIDDAPTRGPKDALVTVVVFSEFQCPFCAKVTKTLDQVATEYPTEVRIVWKDFPLPFHKQAIPAAKLAREVRASKGEAAFWQAHDLLFQNHQNLTDGDLVGYGKQLGLSAPAVTAALASSKHQQAVELDMALGDMVEVKGTPHFFINGKRLVGAQPFEKFKERIDLALVSAKQVRTLMQSRGDSGSVYDHLMKGAKSSGPEIKEPGPIPLASPRRGSKSPQLVVQLFSDLECPFCKRHQATVDLLMDEYGARVSLVYRHLPLSMHANARAAATAAEEVRFQLGDAAFFDFVNGVFRPAGLAPTLDTPGLLQLGTLASVKSSKPLSLAKLRTAIDTDAHAARIDADIKEAERLGIRGTPALLIGHYFLGGAVPYDKVKKLVDKALAEKK